MGNKKAVVKISMVKIKNIFTPMRKKEPLTIALQGEAWYEFKPNPSLCI
jgi:hypothetical protein